MLIILDYRAGERGVPINFATGSNINEQPRVKEAFQIILQLALILIRYSVSRISVQNAMRQGHGLCACGCVRNAAQVAGPGLNRTARRMAQGCGSGRVHPRALEPQRHGNGLERGRRSDRREPQHDLPRLESRANQRNAHILNTHHQRFAGADMLCLDGRSILRRQRREG